MAICIQMRGPRGRFKTCLCPKNRPLSSIYFCLFLQLLIPAILLFLFVFISEKMENLIEMGFPVNACKRAMYFCDGNIEAAMEWLCSHMDDPDYNTGT